MVQEWEASVAMLIDLPDSVEITLTTSLLDLVETPTEHRDSEVAMLMKLQDSEERILPTVDPEPGNSEELTPMDLPDSAVTLMEDLNSVEEISQLVLLAQRDSGEPVPMTLLAQEEATMAVTEADLEAMEILV